ncbi:beta-ketoacyl synthase N-terminal-like domain-containing protein, partial [Kitasatospora sp. NPDC002522]
MAIVGVAALVPGARDAAEFWKLIMSGKDMITDVPSGHWLVEDYYDADPQAADKTYGKRGGFLPPVSFDPLAYGIPPNALPATDTTQLLSLIVAEHVLADATRGDLAGLDRDRVSVILGAAPLELLTTMGSRLQRPVWLKALREHGVAESQAQEICDRIADHYVPWQEATFPGLLSNVVAGRIANRFDLHGTNCTTDAACASSLAAISNAVNELALGRSDMVVTGGVDTLNDILMYMCFSKTPALSRSGDCRPFSDSADGTVLGEGLVMFALRRLEDAERDGNRIYAVIRGIGTSSDGRSTAIYAPLPAGQERALRRAYEAAGYSPDTVELVEAHGTGTTAGDLAEITALREVFGDTGRTDSQWCALGSVKSQIGHTKAAAGAVGLLKAALALHHKVLPPTIKVDRPNPALNLEDSPFYLNPRPRPWISAGDHPRRASVSSFGFGGSNFHITLEEYVPQEEPERTAQMLHAAPNELVLISADSAAGLVRRLGELAGAEESFTALSRRSWREFDAQAPARASVVAVDRDDFEAKSEHLAGAVRSAPVRSFSLPTGISYATGPAEAGQVAFLFSGQGSQYVGMGSDLMTHFPEARQAWSEAARVLSADRTLQSVVFPPSAFTDTARAAQQAALGATEWAQPALAAQSLAQLSLLRRLGLTPDCVGGHSFGELMALHAAGTLDARTVVHLARRRGEFMRDASECRGTMLAVTATRESVENLLTDADLSDGLWISAHNAPTQVVVSGEAEAVSRFEHRLAAEGVSARRLRAATAFHSPLVAPASAGLLDSLQRVEVEPPRCDVYGNADGNPYPAEPAGIRERLSVHLARPVNFVREIEAMYEAGVRTFVEVGAGSAVAGLIGQILEGREHLAVSLDQERRDGLAAFHDALGRLAIKGVVLDLDSLWAHTTPAVPQPARRPGLSVTISGANYGKVYPPSAGAAALPGPNAEPSNGLRPGGPTAVASAALPASLVEAAEVRRSPAPPAPSTTEPAADPTPKQHPMPRAADPGPAHSPTAAGATEPWLRVLQESDRQTAEAHAAYQRAMTDSHLAFLALAGNSLASLASLPGSVVAPACESTSAVASPQRDASLDSPLPVNVPIRPSEQATTPAPAAVDLPRTDAAPDAADGIGLALGAVVLSVVAEKTGYPVELLRPEMELETDLGI